MTEKTLEERLDQVFGDHMDAETAGDLEGTLATMAPNPHIVNIPTMIGGQGCRRRPRLLRQPPDRSVLPA